MNFRGGFAPRTLVVGVITAVVLFATASTLLVAAVNDGFGTRRPASSGVTCSDPRLAGPIVHVTLSDMNAMMGAGGMMGGGLTMVSLRADTHSVRAGQVSFVVHNRGGLVHELLVMSLPADGAGTRAAGNTGKVDETAARGEASRPCGEGSGDGLGSGSTGWVTVNLPPGRYELICNEPWHYTSGMFDVLTAR